MNLEDSPAFILAEPVLSLFIEESKPDFLPLLFYPPTESLRFFRSSFLSLFSPRLKIDTSVRAVLRLPPPSDILARIRAFLYLNANTQALMCSEKILFAPALLTLRSILGS